MTMTREELKGKQTPGTWVCDDPGMVWCKDDKAQVADTRGVEGKFFAPCEVRGQRERHANAALISEAGTVANRTGMWPEDLVQRVKELEQALKQAKAMMNEAMSLVDDGGKWDILHAPGTLRQGICEIDATLNKPNP